MFYVYILLSNKDNKRYIGMTSDIQRRIFEHNSGLVKSTRNRRPLDIVHYETFETKSEALLFEKKLKDKKGKINIQLLKEDVNYRQTLFNKP
ncbi:MAG TPA: excinuclease ABC subunit C [Ignavibacteriales bacterium]|nr:excinuclease ABC subunit C [Ignavibacteriales bacterium]